MQESSFSVFERLAPRAFAEISLRAQVIERIYSLQPVGRRALANRLKLKEREVRNVCESLREDGLISMTGAGMSLTEDALPLLDVARRLSGTRSGISGMETMLESSLNVMRVRIVPEGDLQELGRIAAAHIRSRLKQGSILAVSGGETVRAVADNISTQLPVDVLVLPARGGFGEKVEVQADTLAEEFALRLGGRHRLLHMPDDLPESMAKEFRKISSVSQTLDDLRRTDILLYGIAGIEKAAAERQIRTQREKQLLSAGAKAFVLGSWYDSDGRRLEEFDEGVLNTWDYSHIPHVIAVACGERKGEAVLSVLKHHPHELLVTDEACASKMLDIIRTERR